MSEMEEGWYWVRRKSFLDMAGFARTGWMPAEWRRNMLWLPEVGGPETAWPYYSKGPAGPYDWGRRNIGEFEFGPKIEKPPDSYPEGYLGKCWKPCRGEDVNTPERVFYCPKQLNHEGKCGLIRHA